MIKYILSILFCFNAFATSKLELKFSHSTVKQGEILKATIRLDAQSAQEVDFQKIKGSTIGKTLYFYNVSPLMRKSGSEILESEAKIIFIQRPKENSVKDTFQGKDITVSWTPIDVSPVEAQKDLLFANFEIPSRPEIMIWVFLVLGLIVILTVVSFYRSKWKKNNAIKLSKKNLKNSLNQASQYEEIVEVWKNKRIYLEHFPHLVSSFEKLEKTLFLYQFKSSRTEEEIQLICKEYKEFLNDIKGGLDGI